jgi:CheY-like chemotaxis protein
MKESNEMEFPNILLAEDDKDDYLFLVEAFKKVSPGSIVTRAVNGLECMAILKKNEKPDVVFLDLNMPIKNGLDCLKFIKNSEALTDIPVIIYSTSHYIKDIDTAFKNDAHYYIVKPSSPDDLADILLRVLNSLRSNLAHPRKENFVVRLNAENANHY